MENNNIIKLVEDKNRIREEKFISELNTIGIHTIKDLISEKDKIVNFINGKNRVYCKLYDQFKSRIPNEIQSTNDYIQNNFTTNEFENEPISDFLYLDEINVDVFVNTGLINSHFLRILTGKTLGYLYNMSRHEALTLPGINNNNVKGLLDLQLKLKENTQQFIEVYDSKKIIKELPFDYDPDNDIAIATFNCMNDLFSILNKSNNIQLSNVVSMYYLKMYDKDKIGVELSKTGERIRQILIDDLKVRALFSGSVIDNVKIVPNLIDRIKKMIETTLYTNNFINSISSDTNISKEKLDRIAELFDVVIIRDLDDEQTYIVKDGDKVDFRENHRALCQVLKYKYEPLSFQEIILLVKNEINPNRENLNEKFIKSFLDYSIQFERVSKEYYQIRWPYLSSIDLKAKRILYEENNKLSKEEILGKYNSRAIEYQLDEIKLEQLIIISSKEVVPLGRSGYWKYEKNGEKHDSKLTAPNFILEYFNKNNSKTVTFEEVRNALYNTEDYQIDDTSIRTYILKVASPSIDDKNQFMLKAIKNDDIQSDKQFQKERRTNLRNRLINNSVEYLKLQPENQSEYNDFYIRINAMMESENLTIKRKQNFYSPLQLAFETGILLMKQVNDINYIQLNIEQWNQFDAKRIGMRTEPEYKKNIRSLAINYLKTKEGFRCSLKELRSEFEAFIPSDINKSTSFYKIFNDSYFFNKDNNGNISLNILFLPKPKEYTEPVDKPEKLNIKEISSVYNEDSLTGQKNTYDLYHRSTYNWEELKSRITKELNINYYKFTQDMIDTGVNLFYEKLNGTQGVNRWGASLLQTIYDLWFYKSDYFDRDTYLIKLSHGYETYLRGFTINNENIEGLSKLIELFEEMKELKSYKYSNEEPVDKQKKTFSYILGTLIYYGNLYRHDANNESLDIGLYQQIKIACDFIALYIYTAYILSI